MKKSQSIKPSRDKRSSSSRREIADVLENYRKTLDAMQRKVFETPALNGGFDKLTEKVGKIEDRVELIHDRMFDPDEGVFARIKNVETAKAENIADLEREVIELRIWKDNDEKMIQRDAQLANERAAAIKDLEDQVKELTKTKNLIKSIMKWTVIAFASATVTLAGKFAYDVIKAWIG